MAQLFSRASRQTNELPAPSISTQVKRDKAGNDAGLYVFNVERQLALEQLDRDRAATAVRQQSLATHNGYLVRSIERAERLDTANNERLLARAADVEQAGNLVLAEGLRRRVAGTDHVSKYPGAGL